MQSTAYLFQVDIKTWGDVVNSLGYPLFFLIIAGVVIWKWLIPRLDKKDQENREQNERLIDMVSAQLDEAKRVNREQADKFINTVDTVMAKQTEAINMALNELKGARRGRQ
jgi:Na+/glutamate symporter